MPNVLLESHVLKKFIISSDCPTGPREILLNGRAGFLFNVGDYIKLSNLILYYSKNRNKWSNFYKNLDTDIKDRKSLISSEQYNNNA